MTDLTADTLLAQEIRPNGSRRRELDEAAQVFATGASGLVGAFLVAEILERTHARVVCLVRADRPENGLRRIRQQLEAYRLWKPSFEQRLESAPGDLGQPLLGMSRAAFDAAAEAADVVVHCGASVSFVQPYAALRAPNVGGTKEVLRFACRGRDKTVHYLSSTSVFTETADLAAAGVREIRESEAPLPLGPAHSGYAQSKWVAEKLVANARDRGMPAAIYRPSTIVGNSRTGVASSMGANLIRAWLAIGALPQELRDLNLVPIDYVTRSVVHLAMRRDSVGKAFHLVNPVKTPFSEIAEMLRAHGHPLPQIPNAEWRQRLATTIAGSRDMGLVALCMVAAQVERHQRPRPAQVRLDATNTIAGLAGSSIACPRIDRTLLDAFYRHMQEGGFLQLPRAPSAAAGA